MSEECNDSIHDQITEEEIKRTIDSLGELKAPGPDGLNDLFYKQHWQAIKSDVCAAIQLFFSEGTLPEFINETLVALVPKVEKPEKIGQLMSISCCNFMYKIITKIMVSRLKPHLDGLISPTQSAFISGRQIQDNIIVAHEVFHALKSAKHKEKEAMAIKLDMNKAYDRLEWDYICGCLEVFGFNEKWIDRIMACVMGATYRFKINGETSARVLPQRGLRQGDPLSPYLFVLTLETISCLLEKSHLEGNLKGLQLNSNCPTLTHLLFADDALLFAEATKEEAF